MAGTFYSSEMPRTTSGRPQRRILEATVVAGLLGAAPSLLYTSRRDGVLGAWGYGISATRAVGTLVRPGRPSLMVGAVAHFGISVAFGQALGRILPDRHPALWGAAAGLAMGLIGAGAIGRRSPAIRDLPFGAQVADNVFFGVIFALVVDRPVLRSTA
jgi:hypothetical protein